MNTLLHLRKGMRLLKTLETQKCASAAREQTRLDGQPGCSRRRRRKHRRLALMLNGQGGSGQKSACKEKQGGNT